MKINYFLFILLAGFLITVSSCKKDEDTPKTKKELLTGPSCWKILKVESYDEDGKLVDVTDVAFEECDKDNCLKFSTDGKFVVTDDGVKCEGEPAVSAEGTWALSNNDTQLDWTEDGTTTNYTILKLESNTLQIKTDAFFGIPVQLTFTN
ncbi:MAG: lipocalin family protein [Saprospiraceae bacterium]|nr:lipocalin family protein [Saprospiraceae bacterium]